MAPREPTSDPTQTYECPGTYVPNITYNEARLLAFEVDLMNDIVVLDRRIPLLAAVLTGPATTAYLESEVCGFENERVDRMKELLDVRVSLCEGYEVSWEKIPKYRFSNVYATILPDIWRVVVEVVMQGIRDSQLAGGR